MSENSVVFIAILTHSVIIVYKGEGAVRRCEVWVQFFYNWPFLLYISPFFVVCVRLSAAITGLTVFCLLDKMLSSASILTQNHIET